MTPSYGIKVSRPGFDVNNAKIHQLAFSSAFKTLKVHASGSGSMTDSTRTITIPHNLGYVPLFTAYASFQNPNGAFTSNDWFLLPAGFGIQAIGSPPTNSDINAYADSTNLYITAQDNVGKLLANIVSSTDIYTSNYYNLGFGLSADCQIGTVSGGSTDGAIRIPNLTVAQGFSVQNASLNLHINAKGAGAGDLKYACFGIAEDNTGAFSSSPFGRSSTTANTTAQASLGAVGSGFGITVTDIVNEILARGGWASGNAMGFKILNHGSAADVWVEDFNAPGTYLDILLTNTIASYKYTIFKNQLE